MTPRPVPSVRLLDRKGEKEGKIGLIQREKIRDLEVARGPNLVWPNLVWPAYVPYACALGRRGQGSEGKRGRIYEFAPWGWGGLGEKEKGSSR